MMDTLGEVMEEEEKNPAEQTEPETSADEPEPVKEEPTTATQEDAEIEQEIVNDEQSAPTEPTSASTRPTTAQSPRQPKELVAQGISFLTGLAQTLQSPEATEQLVNSLVETNAETGESHLRIPVPDKQTVSTLLNLVGKLFAK